MANRFYGSGNLGNPPELRTVEVNGEPRQVASLRVYFDRQVPNGDDFEDRGGFWLNVSLWGERAEQAVKLLTKGARVTVSGTLVQHTWEDENGEEASRIELNADRVSLDLARVERVEFRRKSVDDAAEAQHVSG